MFEGYPVLGNLHIMFRMEILVNAMDGKIRMFFFACFEQKGLLPALKPTCVAEQCFRNYLDRAMFRLYSLEHTVFCFFVCFWFS